MASNSNVELTSYDEVTKKASDDLAAQLQRSKIDKTRRSEPPCSLEPGKANILLPCALDQLLKRHEAAMESINLTEQDESTLALAEYYIQEENHNEALEYYQILYKMRERMYGSDDESEKMVDVMHEIASCHVNIGQFQQSLEWNHRAIKIAKKNGPTLNLAAIYNNYGVALKKAGEYTKALKYYKKSVEMKNSLTSGDTLDKAHLLLNIGILSGDTDDYTSAFDYLSQALIMYHNVHGADEAHFDIADCLFNIAFTHYQRKDYTNSRAFYTKALDEFKKVYHNEPNHDDIEDTTYELGFICSLLFDYSAAEVYYRDLVRINEVKYCGEGRHEKVQQAYRELMKALKAQSKIEEALEMERTLSL